MNDHSSAAKRHRQSERRRVRNRAVRSKVRTNIRQFLASVESNNKQEAETRYLTVKKLIDNAQGKGVYPKNTAARTKSRLAKKLNSMD
ncbi:MAG: 30S ribosomal protein S20 [Spirochaetales bacterium]